MDTITGNRFRTRFVGFFLDTLMIGITSGNGSLEVDYLIIFVLLWIMGYVSGYLVGQTRVKYSYLLSFMNKPL